MEHIDGVSTPPYMTSYRGYGVDSPHRNSIRSVSSFPGASGSVSSFHDNMPRPHQRVSGLASPKGTVPQTNSRAVVSALKGLQEKIRKLELERADAEDNLKRLATESRHYKDVLQKERSVRETGQGVIAKQNQQLEDDLQGAEARCNLLEKQLDYMRKMVQTAEVDRDTAIQRSAMVAKQAAHQSTDDIRGQLENLARLERDHMKLTASHSVAESKIRDLEDKLREEAHQRKLVQSKTAELESVAETNKILMHMASPPRPKAKKKKRKPPKPKPRKTSQPAKPSDHYRLNLGNIPFVVGTSTAKSHSVGANVQTVLSLMKAHNPALCDAVKRRAQRYHTQSAGSTSTSDSENAFEELLVGLQDEFGHITFEHRELARQIQESDDPRIQEDLKRELENLEERMEAKGEQIAVVRRQQQKLKKRRKQQRTGSAVRPKSASAVLATDGGEVEVITTVKTKGAKTPQSGGVTKNKITVLKGMQTLQSSLGKNRYSWD